MKKVTLKLETLTCPSCVKKIEKALAATKGVKTANVLFMAAKVKIEYDEALVSVETLSQVVNRLGFSVLSYN